MRTNQNKIGRWALHPILFVLFAPGLTAIAMQDGQSRGQDEDAAPDWLKYCVACPQHEIINEMAGVWTTTVRSWADPSSEPIVSEGEAEYRWNLGGRFLIGELNCFSMGVEKQAIHILGYDNYRGEFKDVWMDNSTTAFQLSTGDYDKENNLITWAGSSDNVVDDLKDQRFRLITRFVSPDEMVFEMYRENSKKALVKRVEVTFIREE